MKHLIKCTLLLFIVFNSTLSFSSPILQSPSINEVVNGCIDTLACNYNSLANTDDESCIYQISSTLTVDTCESYTWNNTTYTSSGTYTIPATDTLSCDSILELTISPNFSTLSDTTVCDEFIWEGDTITTNGTYDKSFVSLDGCDSTHTIEVTVNQSFSASQTETACDSYLWPLNQTTYTQGGTYTYETTTEDGCSSVFTLDLTINDSYFIVDTIVEACNSYFWRGQTYTQSGFYSTTFQTVDGCDSLILLNLTIHNSDSTFSQVTVCDEFELEGTIHTTSGTYFESLTNANGCDSIHY